MQKSKAYQISKFGNIYSFSTVPSENDDWNFDVFALGFPKLWRFIVGVLLHANLQCPVRKNYMSN